MWQMEHGNDIIEKATSEESEWKYDRERMKAMSEITNIELLFGKDIVPVFAENEAYIPMIQSIREGYKEMSVTFPIVHLRDEISLSERQYQVLIDGELTADETIGQITDGTMTEILTKLSHAFCDYYNAHT